MRRSFVRRDNSTLLFILLTISVRWNRAIVIDNEIEAAPRVYCFQNGLKLQVETKNPFTGHIYVKGMYGNPQCNRNFTGESKQPALNVAYNECIHNREPLATGGMMFTLEVIVQFHPYFTTKIDRAFIVSCSYRESIDVVTQNQVLQGNVLLPDGSSDSIPITRVSYAPLMPSCQYTIHRGTADGPLISFARVGEKVVHKWECLPTADGEFHGVLVHNCFARDIHGNNRIQILDQRGCTLDPFSLPTPTYAMDLTAAYASVHAFKFADDLQISFSCSISLCLRMNSGCVGISPPQCEGSHTSSTVSSGGYGQAPVSSYPGNGGKPPAGYAGSLQQNGGISYSFQDSAPSIQREYPVDSMNSSLLGNLSDVALPEPPPANMFYEMYSGNGSKLVESELPNESSAPASAVAYNAVRDVESTTTSSATTTASNVEDASVRQHFYDQLAKKNRVLIDERSPRVRPSTVPPAPPSSLQSLTTSVDSAFDALSPPTPSIAAASEPSTVRWTTAADSGGLGVFVGEGVVNVQPVLRTPANTFAVKPDYAPTLPSVGSFHSAGDNVFADGNSAPALAASMSTFDSAAAFTNSKQKDAEPVIHRLRSQSRMAALMSNSPQRRNKFRYRTKATTTLSPDEFRREMIEASVDVVAQDFVVFDERNPLPGSLENDTWRQDSVFYRRARNDVCVTTLAFTQIVISAAVFFSSLVALAVFLHMRHRKKCAISDVSY